MKISKKYYFDASHILPRHKGKCGRLHGHTYCVEVRIDNPIEKATQFVIDYSDLDKYICPLIEKFDHQHLNLFIAYPSAENIATNIASYICLDLGLNFTRLTIGVSETPKTLAIWDSNIPKDLVRLDSHFDIEFRSPSDINQVKLDVENYFIRFSNVSN